MQQYQVRILAEAAKAQVLADRLEADFGDEGPVSWYEHDGAWAVDGFFFAESAAEIEGRVRTALGEELVGLDLVVEAVPDDVDWVALSLEGLKPVIAGRFVVYGAHDKDNIPGGLIGLQIEANQAFGTGHHPTTWGCLTALTRLMERWRFDAPFDLGSGSGVLAIAIAKKSRRPVLASDIDPLAVTIARENAEINQVGHLVTAVTAVGFEHAAIRGRVFDIIVANILAGPLKQLSPDFRRHSRPGTTVVLSGILASQAASVLAAFRAQGFVRENVYVKEGWSTLVLRFAGR